MSDTYGLQLRCTNCNHTWVERVPCGVPVEPVGPMSSGLRKQDGKGRGMIECPVCKCDTAARAGTGRVTPPASSGLIR